MEKDKNFELYLKHIESLEKEGNTKEATEFIVNGLKILREVLK